MARSERLKGKGGELEAAVLLKNLLRDPTIHRVLNQPRDGGYDLDGEELRHFAIEVKRSEQARLREWFDGLAAQKAICEDSRIPTIVWRPNNEAWRFFLEMDHLRFSHYVRFINALRGAGAQD